MTVLEAEAPGDLLSAAGALEQRASHPAADAIARTYGAGSDSTGTDHGDDTATRPDGGTAGEHAAANRVSDFESHGNAVEGTVGGTRVLVGHPDAFADQGWTLGEDVETRASEARGFGRLPVVVGRDGAAEGVIVVGDEPRAGWEETLSGLEARGMDVVVLTGDDPDATDAFEAHPAVSHAFAGVPPEGKVATVRHLRERGRVAMVGDGTNDAPAQPRRTWVFRWEAAPTWLRTPPTWRSSRTTLRPSRRRSNWPRPPANGSSKTSASPSRTTRSRFPPPLQVC
ncbi:HAD-IC family P-type ATPase [Saliphagus sp. GCM10025308]